MHCHPTFCRGCGAALPEAGLRRVRRSQVVELPEIRPVVIEAQVSALRCPVCRERTIGELPPGLEPRRAFGPRVEALLGSLHDGHHRPHERLVAVCRSIFGLRISEGASAADLARLCSIAGPSPLHAVGLATREPLPLEHALDPGASSVTGRHVALSGRP